MSSADQPVSDPPPADRCETDDPTDRLRAIRGTIDNLDAVLVNVLAERFKSTQRVGELKAVHGLPPGDPHRESQQIERLRRLAQDAELDPEFAEKILNFIISEVIRHHERIAEQRRADPAE